MTTTEPMDHRALAEELINGLNGELAKYLEPGQIASMEVLRSLQLAMQLAQVHATLAAGTPVADQHVAQAARDFTDLRAAARNVLAHADRQYNGDYLVDASYLGALGAVLTEVGG